MIGRKSIILGFRLFGKLANLVLEVSYLVLILLDIQLTLLIFSPQVSNCLLGSSQFLCVAGAAQHRRRLGPGGGPAVPLKSLDMGL